MMKIINVLALSVLVALVGCGRGGDTDRIPEEGSLVDAQGNSIPFDVAALPLQELVSHSNLIIANNAKRAIESFERNDLAEGVNSLTAVASLPGELNAAQMAAVTATVDEVARVASAAAEGGNENAKYAMETLNIFVTSQGR